MTIYDSRMLLISVSLMFFRSGFQIMAKSVIILGLVRKEVSYQMSYMRAYLYTLNACLILNQPFLPNKIVNLEVSIYNIQL